MNLYGILMAIDVLIAIALISLVLLQHGKGADAGAAFGSGASATVFGSRGSASFLTKGTAVLAVLFFVNSLSLAYIASNRQPADSVTDSVVGSVESPAEQTIEPLSEEPSDESKPDDVPD